MFIFTPVYGQPVNFLAVMSAFCVPVAGLLLAGCERDIRQDTIDVLNRQQEQAKKRPTKVEEVEQGLTMKEVEAVLGQPDRTNTGRVERLVKKEFSLTTWVYKQDGQEIELSFIDGKLQGSVPAFGKKPDDRAPLTMPETKR